MPRWKLRVSRRWTAFAVLVGALMFAWIAMRPTLPTRVRMATGAPGSQYAAIALGIRPYLERRLGRPIDLVEVAGAGDASAAMLRAGEVELAILQARGMDVEGVRAVAPLYADVVHVVARKPKNSPSDYRPITSIQDLVGRKVALGPEGSGMRRTARRLLEHYQLHEGMLAPLAPCYFTEMRNDPSIDASIVTTGILDDDLDELLGTGEFTLVPIPDAEGMCLRTSGLAVFQIPYGLYAEGTVPTERTPTVSTAAFLAVAENAPAAWIKALLDALFVDVPPGQFPTLYDQARAREWRGAAYHPAVRDYHEPYRGLDVLANSMESLAAIKELLVAVGAGVYLLWQWRRRREVRERERDTQIQKNAIDAWLEETMRIEEKTLKISDPDELSVYLPMVSEIKLRALRELTGEHVRGDQLFSIFLQQCDNVISKLQRKREFYYRLATAQAKSNATLELAALAVRESAAATPVPPGP